MALQAPHRATLGAALLARSDKTSSEASLAAARALEAKLQALSDTNPSPSSLLQPIVITELEANAYLKSHSRELLPPGVTDPEVHINSDHVSGAADVNFSQLNQGTTKGDGGQPKTLAWLFGNKQRVAAKGKLETANGQGKLIITNVTVGTLELPPWLVDWAIETYVKPRGNIDLSKPFVLPDHVTHIVLGAGQATFFRSPNKKP